MYKSLKKLFLLYH